LIIHIERHHSHPPFPARGALAGTSPTRVPNGGEGNVYTYARSHARLARVACADGPKEWRTLLYTP